MTNGARTFGMVEDGTPVPSWAERSNAFNPACQPHRVEWIRTAARHNTATNERLYTTWYSTNRVNVAGSNRGRVIAFLQEALGRPVEWDREGWQVTADEALWLGFPLTARGFFTPRQLAKRAAANA